MTVRIPGCQVPVGSNPGIREALGDGVIPTVRGDFLKDTRHV